MKKKFLIISLILLISTIAFCGSSLPYARKCTKCIESAKNDKSCYPSIGIMCRDFGTPNKKINGKVYFCYRCCFGHEVWVQIED